MEKDKIYWLSDSPMLTSGFATMSWNVLNILAEKYECHYQAAHNYAGQTLPPGLTFKDGVKLNFWIHGVGKEMYAKDILYKKIQQLRPKVVGVLLDTFMVAENNWFVNTDKAPAKTLFYFPSDGGGGLPHHCDQILAHVDLPVAMSKHGQKQLKMVHGIDSEYIPHAVDPKIFYKLPDEEIEQLKREKGLANKFIVGCVSRNQGRKMLDRMVKSFAIFCKDKPDAILYMHSDPADPAAVFDIVELIRRLGIENRVVFTGSTFTQSITYHEMRQIYNMMDVFFLSTSGEGFGVPTIEAQACGVPCVLTDYTTTRELVMENGQSGYAVPLVGDKQPCLEHPTSEIVNGTVVGNYLVERGVMDIFKGAEALDKLYYDRKILKAFAKTGMEKIANLYTWDKVRPLWHKAIKGLIE